MFSMTFCREKKKKNPKVFFFLSHEKWKQIKRFEIFSWHRPFFVASPNPALSRGSQHSAPTRAPMVNSPSFE